MDLSFGPEYDAYRQELQSFLQEHWPPREVGADAPFEERRRIFHAHAVEAGYLLRWVPRRYGGSEQEPDDIKAAIIREEFERARAPHELRGIGMMMLVPTLLERGEEWQKEYFVPKSVTGEYQWCQGYSEPSSGSDLASLRTRGELVGDEWVINGQKIWTTSAQTADFMFCLVRTEPDAPKHAGISYLLIPMNQEGIEVRPLRQFNGGAEFNEVFFTNARTKKDWIVGKRGEGWLVSRTTLKHERAGIGNAQGSVALLDGIVSLARSSLRGGRPAIEDPEIRQRIIALEGYVRSHEYSSLRQASRARQKKDAGPVSLMNKLIGTNIGCEGAKLALDILCDDGLIDPESLGAELPIGGNQFWISQYMMSLGIATAGGSANIQRNVIGERGYGLPRDYYAQRSSGK